MPRPRKPFGFNPDAAPSRDRDLDYSNIGANRRVKVGGRGVGSSRDEGEVGCPEQPPAGWPVEDIKRGRD